MSGALTTGNENRCGHQSQVPGHGKQPSATSATVSTIFRRGFSLTELLVVIGILVILMALLFPVFGRAKGSARKVTCFSNIRQVGLGSQLYSSDYSDIFPPYFDHVEGNRCLHTVKYTGSGKYWTEIVAGYIQKVRVKEALADGVQAKLEDLPAVYFCPESSNNPTQPQNYKPGNLSAYGINDHIVNWWTPDHCGGFISHAYSEVVAPATCAMLLETFDWFSPKHDRPGAALALSPLDSIYGHVNGAVGTIDGRHGQSFAKTTVAQPADEKATNNVFFCDGHVKGTPVARLTKSAELWSVGGNNAWP